MHDVQIAVQIYFIGIVIATIMAGIIKGLQVALARIGSKKEPAAEEGK
ncbi:MAG: hypothetical protein FWG53_11125 [Clostridiales bacterium]|nr:hypothetical protein [Clostridiales bacterium]